MLSKNVIVLPEFAATSTHVFHEVIVTSVKALKNELLGCCGLIVSYALQV